MKILVFSDSHGNDSRMRRALYLHKDADLACFLGDGLREFSALSVRYPETTFLGVRGNCDWELFGFGADGREEEELRLEGHRILLTHGHLYGVKGGLGSLISHARCRSADIVLFGHTHEKHEECLTDGEKPLYLFNPGSISRPAGGQPSYGIVTLEGRNALFSHGELI